MKKKKDNISMKLALKNIRTAINTCDFDTLGRYIETGFIKILQNELDFALMQSFKSGNYIFAEYLYQHGADLFCRNNFIYKRFIKNNKARSVKIDDDKEKEALDRLILIYTDHDIKERAKQEGEDE